MSVKFAFSKLNYFFKYELRDTFFSGHQNYLFVTKSVMSDYRRRSFSENVLPVRGVRKRFQRTLIFTLSVYATKLLL